MGYRNFFSVVFVCSIGWFVLFSDTKMFAASAVSLLTYLYFKRLVSLFFKMKL